MSRHRRSCWSRLFTSKKIDLPRSAMVTCSSGDDRSITGVGPGRPVVTSERPDQLQRPAHLRQANFFAGQHRPEVQPADRRQRLSARGSDRWPGMSGIITKVTIEYTMAGSAPPPRFSTAQHGHLRDGHTFGHPQLQRVRHHAFHRRRLDGRGHFQVPLHLRQVQRQQVLARRLTSAAPAPRKSARRSSRQCVPP